MNASPQLPDFPWDSLTAARARAARYPDGLVDLSVGTPVDATPQVIQDALAGASDSPGYPTTVGTESLRRAISGWYRRKRNAEVDPDAILPVIGTKQFIAWMPSMLGISGRVASPHLAYPTYEVGALLAGAAHVRSESTVAWGPDSPDLLWLNSPGNPTGAVLGADHLRKVVDWSRRRPVVVAADECYAGFEWEAPAPSLLDADVCGGDFGGLLVVHSLSKRSNMAGYRFGCVVGDPDLIHRLTHVAKHSGMMVPLPVQHAATVAYDDDTHAQAQIDRYRARREVLKAALVAGGFRVDDSQGGLYLWATEGRPCRETVDRLAARGILVAPGDFYGPQGLEHVRVALTGRDDQVDAAAERIASM